jgi:hypothetical protein
MNEIKRLNEVLKGLAAKRDAAREELDRAFPHGRPEGYAKGYDDRRQVWQEYATRCDRIAAKVYEMCSQD